MIFRIWRASATADGADAYSNLFSQSVLPQLQAVDGFRGAYLLHHVDQHAVEIKVITVWESLDAVRAFAGTEIDCSVVEPDAQAVLKHYDTAVIHFDVVVAAEQGRHNHDGK